MAPRKTGFMTEDRQRRPSPSREVAFFNEMKGSAVAAETMDGGNIVGTLIWIGRYTLIIEHSGGEVLYWKHGLKSIQPTR